MSNGSNGSNVLPPNGDGDHEESSPWLAIMDTEAIEDNFTEHYGAEDVREELRQIMARQNADGLLSGWQPLAPAENHSLSDTGSLLTLNPSPASTNIAEQYGRQDRDHLRSNLRLDLSRSHHLRNIDSIPYLLERPPLPSHLRGLIKAPDASARASASARRAAKRSPRHLGLMGKLNKVRLLGELVEVVESVQGEEEFCEQLQHRLMEFRRTGFRDMEPLMFGSEDQAELVGQPLERVRFAEAIAYLDQNMRLDRDLYQLAEESLKRFKSQRAVLYTRATEAQNKFYDLLDQLVEGENCSDMNVLVRSELHELSGARKCLRRVVNQMIRHPLTERTYSETMRLIKCLVAKLCVLMPFHIPCTVHWGLIRNEELTQLASSLSEELACLQLELFRQREQLCLERRMAQERTSGHLLELRVGNAKASDEEISDRSDRSDRQTIIEMLAARPQQFSDSGYGSDRDSDSSSTTDQWRGSDQRSVQQSADETATRRRNFAAAMRRYKDVQRRRAELGLPSFEAELEELSASQQPCSL
ncbi:uncharacterized protein LOC117903280 [Drosophila subobscura]|uniref:uncharacterized protein LOC117903280 n=1 Tax=Drosophila subobscura TaxID=7241 RepID=UPI00155B2BA5|nr:uncharacterized protein LOC117903280 [Drosophila subobscura]